jgi:hypothetical protein
MPHIRPDYAEQSATNFLIEHRRKPNSLAARLTRDVLLLRRSGSSRRAIAAALGLSQRRVQTILDGAAPGAAGESRPFTLRERDPDFGGVAAALRMGSTMRAEHARYATRCPAPYSYSYFWRRFEDWLDAQPDPGLGRRARDLSGAISGPPADGARAAAGSRALPEAARALRASLAFLEAGAARSAGGALQGRLATSSPSYRGARKFVFPARTRRPKPTTAGR